MKKKQTFTREKVEYKLDEKKDVLVELPERTDLQAQVNSHYDETLYYNLERYFASNVSVVPPSDDPDEDVVEIFEEGTTNADQMLYALERVNTLRGKYGIPDTIDDFEVLKYLRAKAAEKAEFKPEGGEKDEQTQTQQTSEQA